MHPTGGVRSGRWRKDSITVAAQALTMLCANATCPEFGKWTRCDRDSVLAALSARSAGVRASYPDEMSSVGMSLVTVAIASGPPNGTPSASQTRRSPPVGEPWGRSPHSEIQYTSGTVCVTIYRLGSRVAANRTRGDTPPVSVSRPTKSTIIPGTLDMSSSAAAPTPRTLSTDGPFTSTVRQSPATGASTVRRSFEDPDASVETAFGRSP